MPRIRKTSEKEEETKPVRKTRQTVLISDSPVRRSTRIKHVVDSSPELEKSVTSKREFRKKNPNPDKYPTPARVLRNRSPSNDIENSPQATRKLRKRASPEITNIADNTTRSTRYSRRNKLSESEDQSSPPPLTRKTRGKSITDEDDSVSKKKASSKSRKRVVSVPVESSLLEEDKSDYDEPLEKSIVEEIDDSIIIVDEVNSIKSVVKKKEKVNAMEKNLMKRLMSHKLNFSSNESQQEMKNDSSIKMEKSLIDLELSKNENKEKTIEEEYFCEPMEVDTSILNNTSDATKNQNVDNTEKIDVPERMDRNFKPRNSMIETASEKHLITKSRYSLGNKIPNKIVIDEIKNRRQEEKNKKSQKSAENVESKSDEPDEKSEKKRESLEKRQSTEKRKSILNNSVKNSLSKSLSFHLLVTPDKEEFLKSNKEKISKSTERNLLKSHEKINKKRKRRSSDDYDNSNNDFELTMYEYDSMTEERDSNESKNNKSIRNTTLEEEIVPDSEEDKEKKESEEIIESDSKFLDKIFKTSKSKSLGGSEIVSKKTRGFKSLDKMSLETINSFAGKREISELTSTEKKQNNLNKSKENVLLSDEEKSSGQDTEEFVKNTRNSHGESKTPTPRKRLSNADSSKDGKSLLVDEEEYSGEETMETVKNSRKSQDESKTPTPRKRLSNVGSTKDGKSLLVDEEEYSGEETMETVKNSRKSQDESKTPTPRKRLSNVGSTKDGKSLLVDGEESSGEETIETVKNTRKSQGESKTPTSKKRSSNVESTKDGNSLLSDEEESSDQETMETVKSTRKIQNKTPTSKKRSSNVESSKKSSSRGKLDETGDSVSRIPTFMFSQTSESEETCEDASRSIDSDIAREYNLSGKSDLQYSDDDVPGDNCRNSETEHSDSEDEGSDLADFIADDDEESEDSETEHYEESEANIRKKGTKKGTIEIVDEEDEEKESDDDDDEEIEDNPEEVGNKEGDNEESDNEEDDNEECKEVNNKEANDDDESDKSVFTNDLKSSLQLYKSKLTKKGKDDEKEIEKEKTNIPLENKEKEKASKSESENEEEEEETSSDETETVNKKNFLLSSPVLSKSRSDRSLSDEEPKTEKHKESPTLEKSLVETKRKKKSKREFKSTAAKVPVASSTHYELSDADDEPETLSFAEGLIRAADEMKKKAQSIKEGIKGKEERKKKKKSNEDNMRKTKSDDMKRLPDDVLQDLEDVPRPNKRQKMLKKENHDSPSRGIQQPRPGSSTRRPILNSVSSFGSTTEFEIVNLQKEKKQKTQSSLAMKWFKQRMLARNARQPISVYLNQQKKRRAANKEYHSN